MGVGVTSTSHQMPNTNLLLELANAQGEAYVNGSKSPWTAARPKDFALLSLLMQGRSRDDMTFTSGTQVKTQFKAKIESSGFAAKAHGEDHKRGGSSDMDFMYTPLVEYEWHKGILRHDIEFQGGDPFDGASGSQQFYNILRERERDFRLDPLIKMEAELGAQPSAETTAPNAAGVQKLKPLWSGINTWTKANYASGGGEGLFPGMTSQQGLDPTDSKFNRVDGFGTSQLACHKVTYSAGGDASLGDGHIYDRMQYFLDTLGWEPVPMAGEWQEGLDVSPSYFLCSHEAKVWLQKTNRAHGELFAILNPLRDPAQSEAQFQGIPLRCSTTIRNMKMYPDVVTNGVSGASEEDPVDEFDANGFAGPRFYAIDPRTVKLYLAPWRAWEEGPWKSLEPVNEDEYRKLGKMIGNVHFESFVSNGILYPSANIANYSKISQPAA